MIENDYFIADDETGFGPCLVLTGPWNDKIADTMISKKIASLRLSNSAGWKEKDVSFLSGLDFLRAVEIYSFEVNDISKIKNKNILFLGLQCDLKKDFDFSIFSNLEVCKIFWTKRIKGLFEVQTLRHLNIVDYPGTDFSELSELSELIRLQLSSGRLLTTFGLEKLRKLRDLDLSNCKKLTGMARLDECFSLRKIEMENCKNIHEFPNVLKLLELESVRLVDCGDIVSLKPFVFCRNLKKLHAVGNTTIVDGDFDIFLDHPSLIDVWYGNKKHYSISREMLMQRLIERNS
jgi:hypothetical protein